jgi:hypothetical protein
VCSQPEYHAVGLNEKNETLNIHAARPNGACASQPESRSRPSNAKNYETLNIHADRPAALRVFSQSESTQLAFNAKKYEALPTFMRLTTALRVLMNPTRLTPQRKNMRRSNIHAARLAAACAASLRSTQSAL